MTAGGTASTGSAPSQGGVAGANTMEASGALSGTSGHSHAITTAAKFNAGGNVGRLNLRTENRTTVVDWHEVRAGLSYDIDSVVGSGGSAYFSFTEGLRVTGGTAATGADPANAMELTNGNLKLSGAAPNRDVALSNTLTPANVVNYAIKVRTDGLGAVTYDGGYNVNSSGFSIQTYGGKGYIRLTFHSAFANDAYVVQVTPGGMAGLGFATMATPFVRDQQTTYVEIGVWDANTATVLDLSATIVLLHVTIVGAI